jgi:hypothetical protein
MVSLFAFPWSIADYVTFITFVSAKVAIISSQFVKTSELLTVGNVKRGRNDDVFRKGRAL